MYALFRRNFSVLGKRCSIYPNLLKHKDANPREPRSLLHNDNNDQPALHQRPISQVFSRMVQGVDCSFNHVTQQGINHFANDPTHPLDLLLHVFQFFATSFQMDSMNVRAALRPRCCQCVTSDACAAGGAGEAPGVESAGPWLPLRAPHVRPAQHRPRFRRLAAV